jgi:CheY-like chemotaxis protein
LVEDSPFNQKIGAKMLSRAGCSVTVACNGEQCLRVLDEQGPFDVVLMDCHVRSALGTHRAHTHHKFPRPEQMPIMDGLEATRRIREKEKLDNKQHRTPIIALTASTTPDDKAQCTQAGMDGWCVPSRTPPTPPPSTLDASETCGCVFLPGRLGKPFDRALLCATIRRYVPPPPAPAPAASPAPPPPPPATTTSPPAG